MSSTRLWLGIVILIATAFLFYNVANAFLADSVEQIGLRSVVIALLSAFAGGIVARNGFVLPAIALWLALWTVTVYFLYAIAAPVDPNPLPGIARHNWAAFLGSGVAAIVGAQLGQALVKKRASHPAAT